MTSQNAPAAGNTVGDCLRLIGIREVCRRTGRSRGTIRAYLQAPELGFPQPVELGPRDRGWFEHEVEEWINTRRRCTGTAQRGSRTGDDAEAAT